jgi:hypothetical protein
MPYDFNIYHSQITPSIPDYDTISLLTQEDIQSLATQTFVGRFGDANYLSLLGGALSGDLILNNVGGIAKRVVLYSATGVPVPIEAGINFTSSLITETGIVIPRLLITDGRLDITPDPIFNRAEFRIKGASSQFNIFNINTFEFYMRVNPDTSIMFGQNTVALSAGAISMGVSTSAVNIGAHSEGELTLATARASHAEGRETVASNAFAHAEGYLTTASGVQSHAEGIQTRANGNASHAAGGWAVAATDRSWIWKGSTDTVNLSTTRLGQFMVSAEGGVSLNNRVGIGTNSIANALTVVGDISATRTVFSSGAPVVVSSSSFETPTTNISSISNIVALSQATYNALTVKLPTTLYVIV